MLFGLLATRAFAQSPLPDDLNPGANSYVYSLAVQPDGKILVGGRFTTLGGQPRNYLARLHPDGTVDDRFNPGADSNVYSLVVQEDGRILVGGYFTSLGGQPRRYLGRLNADGRLDTSFDPGANSYVYALATQVDGKVLVGGEFTTLGGQRRDYVGRLNPNGTLDSAFNGGAGQLGQYSPNVTSMAVQMDGKILVGGHFTLLDGQPRNYLGRLNADGTLDSAFAPAAGGGPDGFPISVLGLAVQADGKILVSGDFTTLGGQPHKYFGRVNGDGSPDSGFNPGAIGGSFPYVYSIAVQTDGKVLVGGTFTALGGAPRSRIGRLNADGTLDVTFDPGAGGGTTPFVYSLALQADGRILVGGNFSNLGGQPRNSIGRLINTAPASRSLCFDGSVITWMREGTGPEAWRTTFDHAPDGISWTRLGEGTRFLDGWRLAGVSLPPGGTIRARGYTTGGWQSASGWFDESYAGAPVCISPPANRTNDAGTTAKFSVLVGGTEPFGYQWFKGEAALADGGNIAGALTSTLAVSNVFGAEAGSYSVLVTNAHGSVTSAMASLTVMEPLIVAQPVGRNREMGQSVTFGVTPLGTSPFSYQWWKEGVALTGASDASLTLTNLTAADAGNYRVVVSSRYGSVTSAPALLTVNLATPDLAFKPRPSSLVYALAVQPDGKVLVGGAFSTLGGQPRDYLGRLNADGTLDGIFNPGANLYVYSLAALANGKVLVGGSFTTLGGETRNRLGCLNADGSLDRGFNPGAGGTVYSVVLQADGKILVGGSFTALGGQPRTRIGRLNADGTLDLAFNPDAANNVYAIAVQPDGKILVGGMFISLGGQPRERVGRLNADGTLDPTFAPGANDRVYSLAVQADGKILVGGGFTILGGQPQNCLGRLNEDGTLDGTFDPRVKGGNPVYVYSVALQADGKILVGGLFNALGGYLRNSIGRLNADGTLDPTFNPGADYYVYSLAVQADGKPLAGGWFTTLGGWTSAYLGRLNSTAMAVQSLSSDGSTITWLRGGTSPEVWRTTFDYSNNGTDWTALGAGSRIPGVPAGQEGGWQRTGESIPPGAIIRARGYTVGGYANASSGVVELRTIVFPPPPRIEIEHQNAELWLTWPAAFTGMVLESTGRLDPPIDWQPLPNSAELVEGRDRMSLQADGASHYYRLKVR